MLWLNAHDSAPKLGDTVFVEIGFGHHYPSDQKIKKGQLKEVYALSPDGERVEMEEIFPSFYRFLPSDKGCYQLIGKLDPGFVSKTPTGHKLGNKKEIENAISCFRFDMTAKTLVEVGGSSKGFENKSNHPLKIMPLKKTSELSPGATLPVKVFFQDKPQSKVTIKATYADHKDHWAVERKTNDKGIAKIKLTNKGPWLIKAEFNQPYPQKSVCDKYFYSCTLNLNLQEDTSQ